MCRMDYIRLIHLSQLIHLLVLDYVILSLNESVDMHVMLLGVRASGGRGMQRWVLFVVHPACDYADMCSPCDQSPVSHVMVM